MDEIQIARAMMKIVDTGRATTILGGKEVDQDGIKGVTAALALSRARATNRAYSTVLVETTMTVLEEFAAIFDPTFDLVLKGVRKAVAEEDEEEREEGYGLCGICQEEMEVAQYVSAMGCRHKFHFYCIYKWFKVKRVCPLCRYAIGNDQ